MRQKQDRTIGGKELFIPFCSKSNQFSQFKRLKAAPTLVILTFVSKIVTFIDIFLKTFTPSLMVAMIYFFVRVELAR